MALMIPDYIHRDIQSSAEKKIFSKIANDETLKQLICFHSLGLARHQKKRTGEIDFVLLDNKHLICLEVKGGQVTRNNGVWSFTNRYGETTSNREGPFKQVNDSMFSLISDLKNKLGDKINNLVFGYGVLFPDIRFEQESPEWDKSIIYDLRNSSESFSEYLKKVQIHWSAKVKEKKGLESINDIASYLRGDFEIPIPLWKTVENTEEQILTYTQQQYRALDQMSNNRRVLFSGSAGTGKTMLALEKTRRNFHKETRTLLLCFNKLLGAKLKHEAGLIDPQKEFITAGSVHKYFYDVIERAGLKSKLASLKDGNEYNFFDKSFPELFINAAKITEVEKYDSLVIDEGQDILTQDYLEALDCILKNGLTNGEWTIFMDQKHQTIFNRFSTEAYETLKKSGCTEYTLDQNCRNTRQIALQTSFVSGYPSAEILGINGEEVHYVWYKNNKDQGDKLKEVLLELINEHNILPSDITVISHRQLNDSCLIKNRIQLPCIISELKENLILNHFESVLTTGSVHSFKGLENKIVLLTDIEGLEIDSERLLNYVGMSRARNILYIFINEALKDIFYKRISEQMQSVK